MYSLHQSRSRMSSKLQLLLLSLLLLLPMGSANPAAPADTIYYRNQPPDAAGHYDFEFQTSNGITTKAAGNENGAVGVVQYVSLEGLPVTFTYVADANGYQPSGDHAPKHLGRQLEYIRTHPAVDEAQSRSL
ncbi:pupal cuticle protein Edg-78E isoform X2 [Drosophila novamexicana]|uniref:pupal cuticle protein Edg-78E isoform X2 n=1 Tax=Drosophila novamexicana TaxID=47314 RepID=UPI0011E5DEEC|nr:pupal cuticle protein Edg-78E isoform X2 [Drosophila novamexicana]